MVLFAPAMVLFPLALLLLFSRPTRLLAWLFTVIAATIAVFWLVSPGGLSEQTVKAWIVIASALFAVHVHGRAGSPVDSAIGGSLVAAVAVLAWYITLRIPPSAPLDEVQRGLWASYRALGDLYPALRGTTTDAADSVTAFVGILPGSMLLAGVSGLLVAWRWYQILADAPVGTPPLPFQEFRFDDHLIWLLVLGLGGVVAQMAGRFPAAAVWPSNLLILVGGLYFARGAAVTAARMRAPWPVLLLGPALPILFLSQLVIPGLRGILVALLTFALFAFLLLFGVGVADTWLDFRHRTAAASGD